MVVSFITFIPSALCEAGRRWRRVFHYCYALLPHPYPTIPSLLSSLLSKLLHRNPPAFHAFLLSTLHIITPHSYVLAPHSPSRSRKVFRHSPYLPSQASASEVLLPHSRTFLLLAEALGLLVCYGAGLFGVAVSAPCRF